jgi:hypothetical protein
MQRLDVPSSENANRVAVMRKAKMTQKYHFFSEPGGFIFVCKRGG